MQAILLILKLTCCCTQYICRYRLDRSTTGFSYEQFCFVFFK